MKLEQLVLESLQGTEQHLSGESLAERLGVSRGAVWKAVKRLQQTGVAIEAVTNRGYRLADEVSLRKSWILERLRHKELELVIEQEVDSTNTVVKRWAEEGAPEGCVLLAEHQSCGRGRQGRSFYSPKQTGLYMSLLLRPRLSAREATLLTVCAAVAVAESIEAVTGRDAQIKWVNDIFCDGKKVCGILTEAQFDLESGQLSYAALGIGVNLAPPQEGFPEELQSIAGGVLPERPSGRTRCYLAAEILDRFLDALQQLDKPSVYEAYRRRLFLLGKKVQVLTGISAYEAVAVDLDQDFNLLVQLPDGTIKTLGSGEVRLRPEMGSWEGG